MMNVGKDDTASFAFFFFSYFFFPFKFITTARVHTRSA
jgi:hypothetical protein